MSYCVTAYTVDLDAIACVLGRTDAIASGAICDAADEDCASADRASQVARGTTVTALHELLTNPPPRLRSSHGHALRVWMESSTHSPTRYLRDTQAHPNDAWSSMRSDWFDGVSRALQRTGHPGLPGMPLHHGLPFQFALYDEWPLITYLPRGECAGVCDSLDAALAVAGWEPQTEESARQLRRWIADAALWEMDLVAFYA
jgi:hypothetical protein